jgi:hypothetical protein
MREERKTSRRAALRWLEKLSPPWLVKKIHQPAEMRFKMQIAPGQLVWSFYF